MPDDDKKYIVQCSLCGRAVWNSDVNSGGRCVNCAGRSEPPEEVPPYQVPGEDRPAGTPTEADKDES